ncbi:unnamed protein product [Auanema sp. JU1783]|nr:unnamed protein product [Auanema sp. JU1783]
MSSLILPKKFQLTHRFINTDMFSFSMNKIPTSLCSPLAYQKRCCSTNSRLDKVEVSYSLKELIESVKDAQKELYKQSDDSAKTRHDSLRAELQAENRAVMLHMRALLS